MKKYILLLTLFLGLFNLQAQDITTIINTMDNVQRIPKFKGTGSMSSTDSFGTKTSTYTTWNEGSTKFLLEFTNPEERGQKILRLPAGIFLFYPDSESTIPIQGAALKQSLFGDVSYEDLTNTRSTLEKYDATLLDQETKNGIPSWKVELKAKTRDVPYPKQILWISKENYVAYYSEYYSLSDKLLKTTTVASVAKLGEYVLVTESTVKDELKKDSSTSVTITDYEMDVPESDNITFSNRDLY